MVSPIFPGSKPRPTTSRRGCWRRASNLIASARLRVRATGGTMIRTLLIASATIFAGSAVAQTAYTAPEMQALLAKGLAVASSDLDGGKVFTARITLAAGGQLSGALPPPGDKASAGAGTRELKGAQVCRTLAPVQPEEICETWVKSGPKQATIQVDGKDASVNKWQ